jgi:hypothetical protein
MSNKDWKQKRIDKINKDIESGVNRYARESKAQYYIDEYHALINSNAASYKEFKKEREKI